MLDIFSDMKKTNTGLVQGKTVTNKRIVLISERKMEMAIKVLPNVEYGEQNVSEPSKVVQRDITGIYSPNGAGRGDTMATPNDTKSEAVRIRCFYGYSFILVVLFFHILFILCLLSIFGGFVV